MHKSIIIIIITILSGISTVPGCSQPQRNYQKAPPPELSTVMEIHGNWIDLDDSVAAAASETGLAILASDRWNTMVKYELVTDTGQPASLVVIGDRGDLTERGTNSVSGGGTHKLGIYRAEARVGRLRDARREQNLLEALNIHLHKLAGQHSGDAGHASN